MSLEFKEVVALIKKEREFQEVVYGKGRPVSSYILILERELEEAKEGKIKRTVGRDSALSEIMQVAAVAIACLEEHGEESDVKSAEEFYNNVKFRIKK